METRIADCPLGAKCEDVKMESGKPVLYRCPWYVQVRGVDVNTGQETDNWGCAIAWMPALMINTANESRKGVAATESFRNAVVKEGAQTRQILAEKTPAYPPNDHSGGLGYKGWRVDQLPNPKGQKCK